MTNNNNTSEYKKISQKLRDKQYLSDVDIETLFDTFKQFYREGESNSVLFSILCDNLPDLRGTSAADEHDLLKALEDELKRQKNEEKWQRLNSDVFFRDEEGRHKINFEILIDNLWTEYVFKTFEDTEELLVYENGVYRNGITLIKAYLERVLGPKTNKHIVSELIAHIQRRSYTQRNLFNVNRKYIPLENGLLNLESFKLENFDPEKLYTFRIPVEYNADAEYTHIVDFFKDVLHPEDIDTMQELFGYVLHAGYPTHKSMWWLGKGRNGKTTAGSLLTALVGIENTAGVPLKQLDGGHRFAVARLFGKLINIVAEPETRSAMQTPTFKAATGGDTIFGEWKNIQKDFPFINFAKFVIYANQVPKIEDASFAFWERVIAIEFPRTFTKEDAKKDYHKTLIKEDGLAGLLNWALGGLKRLRENGWEFTGTKTQNEAKAIMRRQSQPVKTFVDEWLSFDNRGIIPKDSFFEVFQIYCDVYELLVPDTGGFTRELKRNAKVELTRETPEEEWVNIEGRAYSWRGLKLKDDIEVVVSRIKTEEEGNDGTDDVNEQNIAIERYSLLGYMTRLPWSPWHTFFHFIKRIGEKTVVLENKEILPLYIKISEKDLTNAGKLDIPKKGELEQPPTPLQSLIKSVVTAATEEDERGAMLNALVNHIAKEYGFSVDEVKTEIDKLLRDGELMKPYKDEYGNEFLKVVEGSETKVRELNLKDDRSEVDRIIGDRKNDPQEEREPVEITLDIADVKDQCQLCGYGEKWGVKLPYLVFYSKTDKSDFKSACKRCGERIMRDYDLKLSGGDKQ